MHESLFPPQSPFSNPAPGMCQGPIPPWVCTPHTPRVYPGEDWSSLVALAEGPLLYMAPTVISIGNGLAMFHREKRIKTSVTKYHFFLLCPAQIRMLWLNTHSDVCLFKRWIIFPQGPVPYLRGLPSIPSIHSALGCQAQIKPKHKVQLLSSSPTPAACNSDLSSPSLPHYTFIET